jgi:hypothetical protein
MKPLEAEKLLGGHATGTLTEAERSRLFAAALDQQEVFDALMDEEALRELLADPEAKAQLLAALSSPAVSKLVPFWRRTGVLGAAASLLVASLAGIAYLRSPSALPTVPRPAAKEEPAAKAAEAPVAKTLELPAPKGAGQTPATPQRKAAPAGDTRDADQPHAEAGPSAPPAPKPLAVPSAGAAAARSEAAPPSEKADFRRAEARDQLAKKVEAPAAAVAEVVAQAAEPATTAAKAKARGGLAMNAAAYASAPTWTLAAQPDGRTRVTVSAPRGRPVTLLRRGVAGVEVLPIQVLEDLGQARLQWRVDVRLGAGDVLDLYLLNAPVAEPARLPETGPVDGTRARIYPTAK